MRLTDIIIEDQDLEEGVLGGLKGLVKNVTSPIQGYRAGSAQSTGASQTQQTATALAREYNTQLGQRGEQPTAANLLAYLKGKGYPTQAAQTIVTGAGIPQGNAAADATAANQQTPAETPADAAGDQRKEPTLSQPVVPPGQDKTPETPAEKPLATDGRPLSPPISQQGYSNNAASNMKSMLPNLTDPYAINKKTAPTTAPAPKMDTQADTKQLLKQRREQGYAESRRLGESADQPLDLKTVNRALLAAAQENAKISGGAASGTAATSQATSAGSTGGSMAASPAGGGQSGGVSAPRTAGGGLSEAGVVQWFQTQTKEVRDRVIQNLNQINSSLGESRKPQAKSTEPVAWSRFLGRKI